MSLASASKLLIQASPQRPRSHRVVGINLLLITALTLNIGCNRHSHEQAERHFARAEKFVKNNKINEAMIELRRTLQLAPDMSKAHYEYGRLSLSRGAPGVAFAEFSEAVKLNPENKDAQISLAELLLRAGDLPTAREHAEFILKKWPAEETVVLILAESRLGMGEIDAAHSLLGGVVKKHPQNSRALLDLAALQLAQGNYAAAEGSLRRAWAIAPQETTPVMVLSTIFESQGDEREAEDVLKEAVARRPDAIGPKYLLAGFYIRKKRFPEAELLLKQIQILGNNDPRMRGLLAQFYRISGRIQEAEREYKGMLAANDKDRLNGRNLAELYYTDNKKAEANAIMKRLIKDDPNDSTSLVVLAAMELDGKNLDQALADLHKAQAIDPDSPAVYFSLARVHLAQDYVETAKADLGDVLRLSPDNPAALLMQAEIEVREADFDQAIVDLKKVLAQKPKDEEASILLAQVQAAKGDFKTAAGSLQALLYAAQDQGTREQLVQTLAAIELHQKKFSQVRELANVALKGDPKSSVGLSLLGLSYLFDGQPARAVSSVQDYLGNVSWPGGYEVLGRIASQAGELDEAEHAFQKALQLDPNRRSADSGLAETYVLKQRPELALSIYKSLAESDSHDEQAQLRFAQLLEQVGDWSAARATYQKILGAHPKNAVAENNLAWLILEHEDNLGLALKLAQQAKEAKPDDPHISDTLGWIYVQMGTYDAAVQNLQTCVQELPKNANCRYHLGMAYYKSGHLPEARENLRAALSIPGFRYTEDASKLLAAIPAGR